MFLACSHLLLFFSDSVSKRAPRKAHDSTLRPAVASMSHTHHDEGRFSFEPGADVAAVIFEHLKDTETRAALSCVSRTWREAKQRDRARYGTTTTWMEEWPLEYPFRIFVTDARPKIIAENPEGTLGEVDRELGLARELEAQWAKLSDAEKRKYMYLTSYRWVDEYTSIRYACDVKQVKQAEKGYLRGGGWT